VPKENADDFCVVNGYIYYFDPAADTKTQATRSLSGLLAFASFLSNHFV
jgi:hypothetical protein